MAIHANSTRSLARPLLGDAALPRARLLPAASPRDRLGLRVLALRRRTLEHALEASALATMLFAWGVGYTVLCPAEPAHRTVTHVAQVQP